LELALGCAGAAGEDVENQLGAIHNLGRQAPLQIAKLSGGQFVIKDHGIDVLGVDIRSDFLDLAAADQGGGIDCRAALHQPAHNLRAGARGQFRQLGERFFCIWLAGGRFSWLAVMPVG
jgi:hypothetical protein